MEFGSCCLELVCKPYEISFFVTLAWHLWFGQTAVKKYSQNGYVTPPNVIIWAFVMVTLTKAVMLHASSCSIKQMTTLWGIRGS